MRGVEAVPRKNNYLSAEAHNMDIEATFPEYADLDMVILTRDNMHGSLPRSGDCLTGTTSGS